MKICGSVLDADYLVNVPVLKAHRQTRLTCALKHLKGCIPDSEKRRSHDAGLPETIALLNTALRQDLIIVDAIYGDLTFEEGGTPVRMDRVMIANDPVLLDVFAADLIGLGRDDVEYISLAERSGIGSMNLGGARVVHLNEPSTRPDIATLPGGVARLGASYWTIALAVLVTERSSSRCANSKDRASSIIFGT